MAPALQQDIDAVESAKVPAIADTGVVVPLFCGKWLVLLRERNGRVSLRKTGSRADADKMAADGGRGFPYVDFFDDEKRAKTAALKLVQHGAYKKRKAPTPEGSGGAAGGPGTSGVTDAATPSEERPEQAKRAATAAASAAPAPVVGPSVGVAQAAAVTTPAVPMEREVKDKLKKELAEACRKVDALLAEAQQKAARIAALEKQVTEAQRQRDGLYAAMNSAHGKIARVLIAHAPQ